jgi:aryl-alcohol dehydrogenase-like predicted oxidoreductase
MIRRFSLEWHAEALLQAKKEGKVRFLGSPDIRTIDSSEDAFHDFPFDTVQMPLNCLTRLSAVSKPGCRK